MTCRWGQFQSPALLFSVGDDSPARCLRGLSGLSLSDLIGEAISLNGVKTLAVGLSIGKSWRDNVLALAVTDATNHIFVSQLVVELPCLLTCHLAFRLPVMRLHRFPWNCQP
jgi:hypothetical protein